MNLRYLVSPLPIGLCMMNGQAPKPLHIVIVNRSNERHSDGSSDGAHHPYLDGPLAFRALYLLQGLQCLSGDRRTTRDAANLIGSPAQGLKEREKCACMVRR